MNKCLMCEKNLSADNITDNIPFCHACYCERNPEAFQYLKELKERG